MNIVSAIQNGTLETLSPLAAQTSSYISFLGWRYIQNPRFEGKASVDLLAKKVIDLIQEKEAEFTLEERAHGANIAREITRIYGDSDTALARCFCLTKIFCAIRDFFARLSPPLRDSFRHSSLTRWLWTGGEQSVMGPTTTAFKYAFILYSARQYRQTFNREPRIEVELGERMMNITRSFNLAIAPGHQHTMEEFSPVHSA